MNRLLGSAVAAALILAGCADGSSAVPRAVPARRAPDASPGRSRSRNPPTASMSAQRSAKFVSPVSRSAKLGIAPAPGCANCGAAQTVEVSLAGQGSNCTTGPNGRTCTIPLDLVAGSYTGSLIVYDDFLVAGHVSGAELSENTSFPIAMIAGHSNTIGVVLDGIPNALKTTLLTPATMVIGTKIVNGMQTTIYRMIGTSSRRSSPSRRWTPTAT